MIDNARCAKSRFFGHNIQFEEVKIAYRELLSAVIAFIIFAPYSPSSWIQINTDNQNVVSWLNRGRCAKKLGYRLLSVIELIKLKYNLKVPVFYITSSANVTTDSLSRGLTPRWLQQSGIYQKVEMEKIDNILSYTIKFWKKALDLRMCSEN